MSFSYENFDQNEFGITMTTPFESYDDPNLFSQGSGTSNAAANKKLGKDESCIVNVMNLTDGEEAIWKQQSIYKLHSFIKDRNEKIFEPLIVSIGPYHHGKPQLMPMEEHKRRALHHFVGRSQLPVEVYMNALMEQVKILQDSYNQLDVEYLNKRDKFIEIMMVDGCFILEFMDILNGAPKDYAPNDPVFSYYGCLIHYNCFMRDMLLLENQLPFLVLEKLVSVSQSPDQAPQQKVLAILSQMMMFGPDMNPGRHMLDMYMAGLFKGPATPDSQADQIIHVSASKLHQAGIKFKKITNFGEISFDRNRATLNLPSLNINQYSISTFTNLKAFELQGTTGRHFNSYIRLMESLIQSVEDVKLLDSQWIIRNFLETDEAVVKLLMDLARDTLVDRYCNSSIAQKEMTKYYNEVMSPWNEGFMCYWISNRLKPHVSWWISNFQKIYFTNPWSMISVVAATCLLVMTVLQTLFTVKSFYEDRLGIKAP